jgi:hypothetical protein
VAKKVEHLVERSDALPHSLQRSFRRGRSHRERGCKLAEHLVLQRLREGFYGSPDDVRFWMLEATEAGIFASPEHTINVRPPTARAPGFS